jgi:aspartyl-tRNA(Asn)/glutamyl-tRNA(Gln) amidotransferase subunit A
MSIQLPTNPTINDIHNLYRNNFKVSEVVEYFFERIETLDKEILSVVRLNKSLASRQAETLDIQLQNSNIDELIQQQPLFGVPFALKDNILVEGEPLTAQSKVLEGYIATYSADIYHNLVNAGAILVAQTNMDEFAFGSSTEKSGFGQITHNPHDTSRVAGGTSGGSAAIVASGMLPFSIGTDTGGSVRQPASFTGVYGVRPTYGTVSRYGIIASTSSFDQAGPLTNSLADNQLVLSVLSGKSHKDQTSIESNLETKNITKFCVGVPKEFMSDALDKDVKDLFVSYIDEHKELIEFVEVDLPMSKYSLAVYYILQTVEAAANLERFDTVRYGNPQKGEMFYAGREQFGDEVKRRIMLGTYTSSAGYYDAYYNKACQVRELMRQDLQKTLSQVDALIMPASPFPAFTIGANNADPMAMYLADIMTVTHPITRVPGLVIPGGMVEKDGKVLPVGIQLVAGEQGEGLLYKLAEVLEQK